MYMKKGIYLMLAMGAVAHGAVAPVVGNAEPVSTEAVRALRTENVQPKPHKWSFEMGAVGHWQQSSYDMDAELKELFDDLGVNIPKYKMIGAEATIIMNATDKHRVFLRAGYVAGVVSANFNLPTDYGYAINCFCREESYITYVMPGYRFEYPITEKLSFFIGGSVGVACANVLSTVRIGPVVESGKERDAWAIYSAEAGVRIEPNETMYLYVAATATKVDDFVFTGVRGGVGFSF